MCVCVCLYMLVPVFECACVYVHGCVRVRVRRCIHTSHPSDRHRRPVHPPPLAATTGHEKRSTPSSLAAAPRQSIPADNGGAGRGPILDSPPPPRRGGAPRRHGPSSRVGDKIRKTDESPSPCPAAANSSGLCERGKRVRFHLPRAIIIIYYYQSAYGREINKIHVYLYKLIFLTSADKKI